MFNLNVFNVMAVFSTNQNRQLYVANAYSASVSDASAVGTIGGVKVVDGILHFLYKGVEDLVFYHAGPVVGGYT